MCLSRIVWSVARGSRTVLLARSGAACPCISSWCSGEEKRGEVVRGGGEAGGKSGSRDGKAGRRDLRRWVMRRGRWGEGNDGGKERLQREGERGEARVIMLRSSTVPRRWGRRRERGTLGDRSRRNAEYTVHLLAQISLARLFLSLLYESAAPRSPPFPSSSLHSAKR